MKLLLNSLVEDSNVNKNTIVSHCTKPDAIVSASNVINFAKSRCIKHLVSDRLLSLISKENVHNVR